MAGRLKERVHEILQIPSAPGDRIGRAFDVTIMTLIVLNTIAVVVETIPGYLDGYERWFLLFEYASVAVFGAEYLLRLWSVTVEPQYAEPMRGRLRWMGTPFALIDLIAILPIFLVGLDLRFVRVLRVLRVLKLGRYSESMQVLTDVMRRSRRDLVTSLFLVGLALVLTSSFMYYAERDAQPDVFTSIPAAMWWGIVTLTTTGYGDIVPVTLVGRILGGLTVILGVATLALPVGILSSSFVQEIEARRRKSPNGHACPHCGAPAKSTLETR